MTAVKRPRAIIPGPEHAGQRLDVFLARLHPEASRSRLQLLIRQAKALVDGKAEKASYRLRGDEHIELLGPATPPPLKATPEDIPLNVVYEDAALAVLDKPAGMMVHAGAGTAGADDDEADPRTRGTLVNALLHRFRRLSSEGGPLRPGIVHRLDKETSGLMVVAKSDAAHRKLAEAFSQRKVEKTYLALVHGWPKQDSGTVNAPIGRDPRRRHRMAVNPREGREAVTHFRVMERLDTAYGKFAQLEVTIATGRTHQIRVHLASLGHPVAGDTLYGAPQVIEPLPLSRKRARPSDTKAMRDRQTSELARRLTEEKMGMKPARKTKGEGPTTDFKELAPASLGRNFLHAARLAFAHPTSGERREFRCDIPPELSGFLARLRHPK